MDDDRQRGPSPVELRAADPDRLLAFTDGVFAIIITLLVLDLQVLRESLAATFVSFVVSFLLVGMDWDWHRTVFAQVLRRPQHAVAEPGVPVADLDGAVRGLDARRARRGDGAAPVRGGADHGDVADVSPALSVALYRRHRRSGPRTSVVRVEIAGRTVWQVIAAILLTLVVQDAASAARGVIHLTAVVFVGFHGVHPHPGDRRARGAGRRQRRRVDRELQRVYQ